MAERSSGKGRTEKQARQKMIATVKVGPRGGKRREIFEADSSDAAHGEVGGKD